MCVCVCVCVCVQHYYFHLQVDWKAYRLILDFLIKNFCHHTIHIQVSTGLESSSYISRWEHFIEKNKTKQKIEHSQVVLGLRVSGFRPWRSWGSSQGLGPRIFFQFSKVESFIFSYSDSKVILFTFNFFLQFRINLNCHSIVPDLWKFTKTKRTSNNQQQHGNSIA